MATTKIAWCDKVWNPVTGCTEVSAGCAHCYARRMAKRLQAMGQAHYKNGFTVTCHDDALGIPLHWRKPARIFVNSMSDLFHRDVPFEFIDKVFDAMSLCRRHTFMILTKRPERAIDYFKWRASNTGGGTLMDYNIWLGVSVESQSVTGRIATLCEIDASVKFVSAEPLLDELVIERWLGFKSEMKPAHGIDWVIVGGESGPHCRPMNPDWARSLRDQCKAAGVPFFFKQAGGLHHGSDLLDGVEYKEFPK